MSTPATPSGIHVRALHDPKEMDEAVALQKSIWGFEDVDLLPARLFVVATKIGDRHEVFLHCHSRCHNIYLSAHGSTHQHIKS